MFNFEINIPKDFNIQLLYDYFQVLGLNGTIRVWEEENEDENLLGTLVMLSPAKVISVKETNDAKRLEGRIAHEITHVALAIQGFNNIKQHNESINNEVMYREFMNQFSNFLHHQLLYPLIINAGFTLNDDVDIVRRYYSNKRNIEKMHSAYNSPDRFAKAWVVVSLMNDLLRLGKEKDILLKLIRTTLSEASLEAEELLQELNEVKNLNDYERTKIQIEEKLMIPSFEFE